MSGEKVPACRRNEDRRQCEALIATLPAPRGADLLFALRNGARGGARILLCAPARPSAGGGAGAERPLLVINVVVVSARIIDGEK